MNITSMALLARSWGVETHSVRDDHQLWTGSALRFKTEREARDYAEMLYHATEHANAWRVFPSRIEPNAAWHAAKK